jgi:hypothetical protein
VKKLAIILFGSLISANVMADEENLCEPSQAAILYVPSNICHAEYLGNNYQKMLINATSGGPVYDSVGTITDCFNKNDKTRMDRRYAKMCPNLALLETQIAKAKAKARMDAELNSAAPDPLKIKQLQNTIVLADKLEDKEKEEVKEAQAKVEKNKENTNDFYGFNWAPAIAVMSYDSSYIDDVRIEVTGEGEDKVNNVYVDREVDINLAVLLETHYLWPWKVKSIKRDTGIGFFAATNLVKQEGAPLTMFAFGPMFSVRDKDSSNGFSVGLAYFVDTDFKVLRDGLSDGDVTTYSDSAKLIRKVDESGWLFMVSSKF